MQHTTSPVTPNTDLVSNQLVLHKPTNQPPNEQLVRFKGETPPDTTLTLTDKTVRLLADADRSLEDAQFSDGDVIGAATVDTQHESIVYLEVTSPDVSGPLGVYTASDCWEDDTGTISILNGSQPVIDGLCKTWIAFVAERNRLRDGSSPKYLAEHVVVSLQGFTSPSSDGTVEPLLRFAGDPYLTDRVWPSDVLKTTACSSCHSIRGSTDAASLRDLAVAVMTDAFTDYYNATRS